MATFEEQRALYEKVVLASEKSELKGKNTAYTSANGYMYSFLNKAGEIGIRLSKEACQKFKEKHQATEFKSHGAVMKDYVTIPEKLYGKKKLLAATMDEAYDNVMSLKPKPTKKKKK